MPNRTRPTTDSRGNALHQPKAFVSLRAAQQAAETTNGTLTQPRADYYYVLGPTGRTVLCLDGAFRPDTST